MMNRTIICCKDSDFICAGNKNTDEKSKDIKKQNTFSFLF